jgi:hypothetical protein
MNITFTAPTPFVKPWTLEDSRIIFGNDIINLADIINFSVSGKPSALTSGIITILTNDSKKFLLSVGGKQKEQWIEAIYYLETHIHRRTLKKETNVDGVIYDITGSRGRRLIVFEDKVIIKTSVTPGSILTGNFSDGEKTIYYADCIGIQFKESGMQLGYLQLETASALMNNRASNFFNENSFTFEGSVLNSQMKEIADYIRIKVEECKKQKSGQTAAVSAADELKKFKELLDSGVITQEEFDAKKKQLLGL